MHQSVHTGIKPFECQYPNCSRKFGAMQQLKAHQKIHMQKARNTALPTLLANAPTFANAGEAQQAQTNAIVTALDKHIAASIAMAVATPSISATGPPVGTTAAVMPLSSVVAAATAAVNNAVNNADLVAGLKVVPKTGHSLPESLALDTISILDEEFARFNAASLSQDQKNVLHSFVDTVKQRISWTVAGRMSLSI